MKTKLSIVVGLALAASGYAGTAHAQVSCSGVSAFASCTAYASGAKVTYNGSLYHSIAAISNNRDCPPNSPYNPSNDNWWVNDGTCSGGGSTATATKTATKTASATATKTPTATARNATSTATATKTNTATATATSGGGGGQCSGIAAFQSCTAYASGAKVVFNNTLYHSLAAIPSTRDCPPNSPYDPGSDNWWQNDGACGSGGGSTATATATATSGGGSTPTATKTSTATATPTACTNCGSGGNLVGGYFAQWGIYQRNYHVSDIPSGVNRVFYAFNNPHNGRCEVGVSQAGVGDAWADYEQPQNGEAYNAPLAGNWHSLQLKYGGKGVSISIGGWTWSDGFYGANPSTFVASCIDAFVKGNLPVVSGKGGTGAAANVFDGIDLDWEYPGVCGNNPSCGASSADKANYVAIVNEFRKQMDAAKPGMKLSAFVSADPTKVATGYDIPNLSAGLDIINLQGYDFFGAWDTQGPTAPHSPLYQFNGQSGLKAPLDKFYTDAAVQMWANGGAPRSKIAIGVGAYGRGWTGSFSGDGLNQPATGAASGTYDAGVDDYKVLIGKCASNNTGAGTAWCNGGSQWWSYDTPSTIGGKKTYKNNQGLAGMFLWSFDGDNGDILRAMQ